MVTLVLEYYRVMQDQLENCFSDWSLLLKYCIYHELVLNNNNNRLKKKMSRFKSPMSFLPS